MENEIYVVSGSLDGSEFVPLEAFSTKQDAINYIENRTKGKYHKYPLDYINILNEDQIYTTSNPYNKDYDLQKWDRYEYEHYEKRLQRVFDALKVLPEYKGCTTANAKEYLEYIDFLNWEYTLTKINLDSNEVENSKV